MSRYRPRHAQRSPVARLLGRAVVPGGVVAVLATGVAVAAWPNQPATTAEPAPATATAQATVVPDALRTERPNRSSERSPLPSGSPSAKKTEPASENTAGNDKSGKDKSGKDKTEQARTVGDVVGKRYVRVDVKLRTGAGTSYGASTVLKAGKRVAVTDLRRGSWTQVIYSGDARWVKTSYLTTKKPSAAQNAGVSSAKCPGGSSVESGLTPDAVKVHRAICHAFPQVRSYGGVRADSLPEHPSGRAVDAMISSSSTGWKIARWVQDHRKELGVSQIIYSQKIWTVQRSGEGWRSMPDRGSASANHYDHVHVTVYGNAAD